MTAPYTPTPAPWPVPVRHIDGTETLGITWRYAERGTTITCRGCTRCHGTSAATPPRSTCATSSCATSTPPCGPYGRSRTMTLRDDLAAVLGPGNDDATAYAQADAVLGVIRTHVDRIWTGDMHANRVLDQLCDDLETPDMKWNGT